MTAFHIPGVSCPCGSPDLVAGSPGTEADYAVGVLLVAEARARAWCSPECARAGGGYVAVVVERPKTPRRGVRT